MMRALVTGSGNMGRVIAGGLEARGDEVAAMVEDGLKAANVPMADMLPAVPAVAVFAGWAVVQLVAWQRAPRKSAALKLSAC